LEDYGDVFMSLAYFWDSFDHLMAVTVQFNDAMNALNARYLMRNNRHLANSVGFVREEVQYITVSLTRRFKSFDQEFQKMWPPFQPNRSAK
jgi:hypothetical protein